MIAETITTSPAAIAAVSGVVMYGAHQVMDHWGQSQHQADHKGEPGNTGRWNCLKHVITYTLGCTAAVVLAAVVLGFVGQLHPVAVAIAAVINGGSHYWADRRTTLRNLARRMGKVERYYGSPAGAYQLDQAWHYGWLAACAVITAIGAA